MNKKRLGQVYFLQVEKNGPVKIGFTEGIVYSRVKSLQQSSPHELHWIGAYIALPVEEKRLHHLFDAHHLRAEWFKPHYTILDYIQIVSPDFGRDKYIEQHFRISLQKKIREACSHKRLDWFPHFAEAAGVRVFDFHKWMDCRRIYSSDQMDRIEARLDELVGLRMEQAA